MLETSTGHDLGITAHAIICMQAIGPVLCCTQYTAQTWLWPHSCAGDKYEGEWKNGRENGVGTSMAADGSTFYGFWLDGLMHGEGVSVPCLQ